MTIPREKLGAELRIIRNQRAMTIEQLANESGLHATHIGKIERGETSPTIEVLGKIVNSYDLTLEDLFSIIEKKKSKEYSYVEISLTRHIDKLSGQEKEKLLKFIELFFD